MIILYSITGLITLTFLSIIITGAIRAHRHPERYGPRNFLGRPTQSRARGLARAILDTLPIVKFGDRIEPKQAAMELEGQSQASTHAALSATAADPARAISESKRPSVDVRHPPSEGAAGAAPSTDAAHASGDTADEGLGCSICTDDFENGQDIRVLPCNHKFHPACVDPWLLDVSGTCPLCRIDLRPDSNGTGDGNTEAGQGLAPPLESPDSRRRTAVRRFFAGARHMDRQQRIEALRRWRTEHGTTVPAAAQNPAHTVAAQAEASADTQRRQSRLRGFLRRA